MDPVKGPMGERMFQTHLIISFGGITSQANYLAYGDQPSDRKSKEIAKAIAAEFKHLGGLLESLTREPGAELWQSPDGNGTIGAWILRNMPHVRVIRHEAHLPVGVRHLDSLRTSLRAIDEASSALIDLNTMTRRDGVGQSAKWSDLHALHDRMKATDDSCTTRAIVNKFKVDSPEVWREHAKGHTTEREAIEAAMRVLENYRRTKRGDTNCTTKSKSRKKTSAGTSRKLSRTNRI